MDFAEEGFYYSSGGEEVEYHDGVEEVAEDSGGEEPDYVAVSRSQKHYKILKEDDIRQLQENDISNVSSLLSVSRGEACTLLCRNNWNPSSVNYDEWFAGDDRNSEPVGILGKRKSMEQVCNICYENIPSVNMVSTACGHPFCADCWKTYIATSINDGPGCLTLVCPEPECKATVGLELVDSLASVKDRDKYYKYLCRSYVERSRNRKWCPAPGCNLAIEFFDAGECESENYDVTCDCSCKFCWKCTEEHHRPVDCKTVAEWIEKNSSEGMNAMWIVANTKPCPNCKRPIQKNQGCSSMRCIICGVGFCWLCLKPWNKHSGCNGYRENDVSAADQKRRTDFRKHLGRYIHYYERWDSNDKSRKTALVDLDRARDKHVETLALLQGASDDELKFVTKAWEQIVECRRVLKWTYAYGYYLSLKNISKKMNLFEFLQGQAETALERLHYCAEKEMDKYFLSRRDDFKDFRQKLGGLTEVTKNYFENLVRALENNLSEVDSKSSKNQKH